MTTMDVISGIPHLLWTASWQAGVMTAAVWLACRQWPRMPANLRVMLWWLVSLKFIVGLVWTQPIPLPVLPAAVAGGADTLSIMASPPPGTHSIGSDGLGNGSNRSMPRFERGNNPFRNKSRFGEWVVSLWLLGVIAQGVLLVRQLVRTRRLIARSVPVEGDAAELFDDLVARLDVRVSQPTLRVSTAIGTPQVTGLRRPVVLLPVGTLESFSTRELSLTLCHELMHVKRFDLWHGWIPSLAARLFFFHPLARFAAREYAIAREAACDARVLASMDAPAYDYGRLLMRLGITAREAAPAAAGASPTLQTLKRRLLMLHDASPNARGFSPRWWTLAAIAAVLVIPMRPTAAQNRENPRNHQNQPNHQNHPNQHAENHKNDHGEAWVFVKDAGNSAMHGSSMDLAEAKRQRANDSEPLIWFKREGRAYVIRDAQTLDKALALFMPQEQLNKAMRGLDDRQVIFDAQQHALSETQKALSEQARALDDQVEEAAASIPKSADQQVRSAEEASRTAAQAAEAGMRAAKEASMRNAEAHQRDALAHQETLAMRQRAIGEHQAAIGAEQAVLSRQLEELGRSIEWEMRNLFSQAIAAGVATPVK